MKRSTKMGLGIVAVGLTLASATAVWAAKDKMEGHRGLIMAEAGHHGGGKYRGKAAMREQAMKMFTEHDANKDGAVTQAEVDAVRKGKLDKYDTNKDGTLSLSEFEPMWLEQMKSRMVNSFQRLDDDGSGTVTNDEFVAPFSHIISRHDMDNDGDVDEEELNKLMKGKRGGHHKDGDHEKRGGHHKDGDHEKRGGHHKDDDHEKRDRS